MHTELRYLERGGIYQVRIDRVAFLCGETKTTEILTTTWLRMNEAVMIVNVGPQKTRHYTQAHWDWRRRSLTTDVCTKMVETTYHSVRALTERGEIVRRELDLADMRVYMGTEMNGDDRTWWKNVCV